MKSLSLKDVAKLAGVGLGTASRVLNGDPHVSDNAKQCVLDAMEQLHYRPNSIARSLKTNSTRTIGIVISYMSNLLLSSILAGMEDSMHTHEYQFLLFNTQNNKTRFSNTIQLLQEKKVEGVMLLGETIDSELKANLKVLGVPIALLSLYNEEELGDREANIVSIGIDNTRAAYDATRYLCDQGHRELAMLVNDASDYNAVRPRMIGFRRALEELGLEYHEDWALEGKLDLRSGYINMQRILDMPKRPTAIFAGCDMAALGAIHAILERGLRVPEDISIVGFDDIEIAEYIAPPLTTVRQPHFEMGSLGMQLMLKMIAGEPLTETCISLDHTLVRRASSAPPKSQE